MYKRFSPFATHSTRHGLGKPLTPQIIHFLGGAIRRWSKNETGFFMEEATKVWESEGGAGSSPRCNSISKSTFNPGLPFVRHKMSGTPSQLEWAEQIRPRVNTEFDRVAKALTAATSHRGEQDRADTQAVIAILEEKRAEVMAKEQAGYFIREWQELRDQVRKMIGQDSRYQAIKARKAARR